MSSAAAMDVFEEYFKRADLDRDGKISGDEAVAFLQGSNLPRNVLAQVGTSTSLYLNICCFLADLARVLLVLVGFTRGFFLDRLCDRGLGSGSLFEWNSSLTSIEFELTFFVKNIANVFQVFHENRISGWKTVELPTRRASENIWLGRSNCSLALPNIFENISLSIRSFFEFGLQLFWFSIEIQNSFKYMKFSTVSLGESFYFLCSLK